MERPDALEGATRLRTGTGRAPLACAIDNSEMRPRGRRSDDYFCLNASEPDNLLLINCHVPDHYPNPGLDLKRKATSK